MNYELSVPHGWLSFLAAKPVHRSNPTLVKYDFFKYFSSYTRIYTQLCERARTRLTKSPQRRAMDRNTVFTA